MTTRDLPGDHVAPSRPDGRSTRYADHRARLLAGAIEHVLTHGVAGLRLRPLAAELGVSPAALLNHFGSKEGLIAEVLQSFRTYSMRVTMKAEGDRSGDPTLAAYDRWFARWTDDAVLPGVRLIFECYVLGFRDPGHYGAALTQTVDDWLAYLRTYLRSLGCPDDELDDYASLMFATMTGQQIDLLASGEHARIAGGHRRFVALLEHARTGWRASDAPAS